MERDKEKKLVLLDTSFLCAMFDYKLDVFTKIDELINGPYEIVITQGVLDELNLLSTNPASSSGRAARLALSTLTRIKYHVLPLKGKADETIEKGVAKMMKEWKVVLCTIDKALMHRIKKRFPNVAIATIKGKKRVSYG
jgi:rRNA-processing protein FCF1